MAIHHTDILMIGGGIMSVTLASLIARLDSSRSITLAEQSGQLGEESSDAWNNAGTGHAGYCELNYTPQQADGSVAIDRALAINEQFEVSLQFWSSLVERNDLSQADGFIRNVPHLSWVQGKEACQFLQKRQAALQSHPLFGAMEFTSRPSTLSEWLPLIMGPRSSIVPTAATRVAHGSDVNFGSLTRQLGRSLSQRDNTDIRLKTRVTGLTRKGKTWLVTLEDLESGQTTELSANFVFVGAGGAALHLLQKARVPEAKGYGGFPVSGLWLACEDQNLASAHHAKVYSQAPVGAPPMSVPHLDTRFIDGKPALLFGPFAGFTTRFLKSGSVLDLAKSIRSHNLRNLLDVAVGNWPLTRYLIKEALSSRDARLDQLRGFMPDLEPENWYLRPAGQRVQIIKTDDRKRGKLEFGTEVLTTADRSMAALLGASPGASTCVSAMLDVIERCMPELVTGKGLETLQTLIPSYGQSLKHDGMLLEDVRRFTSSTLGLAPTATQRAPERSISA
ncbi:malate dehydrogenase (quinone) [Marinobacter daqiaonensis]|uniref:Probable malate:quinone oxidoreductase n=1 Tax=Marinobacter daqiaonensis TaxID=650891 RepID=A0A1I6I4G3_9GAMM|nr:malate dehydrogenase (quinone) [Marinobacter daqiaonensis]SFR61601.1 malate dehydrogenase (quinone) [Marinobacter daqiaonensis]